IPLARSISALTTRSSARLRPGCRRACPSARTRRRRAGEAVNRMPALSQSKSASLPTVRAAVRSLLLATPAYRELDQNKQRSMAQSMVRVCHAAVSLIQEEIASDDEARSSSYSSRPTDSEKHEALLEQQREDDREEEREEEREAQREDA